MRFFQFQPGNPMTSTYRRSVGDEELQQKANNAELGHFTNILPRDVTFDMLRNHFKFAEVIKLRILSKGFKTVIDYLFNADIVLNDLYAYQDFFNLKNTRYIQTAFPKIGEEERTDFVKKELPNQLATISSEQREEFFSHLDQYSNHQTRISFGRGSLCIASFLCFLPITFVLLTISILSAKEILPTIGILPAIIGLVAILGCVTYGLRRTQNLWENFIDKLGVIAQENPLRDTDYTNETTVLIESNDNQDNNDDHDVGPNSSIILGNA